MIHHIWILLKTRWRHELSWWRLQSQSSEESSSTLRKGKRKSNRAFHWQVSHLITLDVFCVCWQTELARSCVIIDCDKTATRGKTWQIFKSMCGGINNFRYNSNAILTCFTLIYNLTKLWSFFRSPFNEILKAFRIHFWSMNNSDLMKMTINISRSRPLRSLICYWSSSEFMSEIFSLYFLIFHFRATVSLSH